jgi:hypothetical protein
MQLSRGHGWRLITPPLPVERETLRLTAEIASRVMPCPWLYEPRVAEYFEVVASWIMPLAPFKEAKPDETSLRGSLPKAMSTGVKVASLSIKMTGKMPVPLKIRLPSRGTWDFTRRDDNTGLNPEANPGSHSPTESATSAEQRKQPSVCKYSCLISI